jgi:hypothetical protein
MKRMKRLRGLLFSAALVVWFVAQGILCQAGGHPEESASRSPEARPLLTAIHVHSTASTGTLSVESLAQRAERLGLDAVILSDNFVLRYEYGLAPLQAIIKRTITFPSVVEYGFDRYLSEVAEVQARHSKLVIVPGVEVAPHYFWSGSLWNGTLTMHNAQKNLLVVGLKKPEDYRDLPALGNAASYRYGMVTWVAASFVLLVIPAARLWVPLAHSGSTRRRALALCLFVGVGWCLLAAWPFKEPHFTPYDGRAGYAPYQALIDSVSAKGGLVLWSMPDAKDFSTHSFGRLGTVTVKTDPYQEALVLTSGYHGFGGLYQEARTAVNPGGVWDQVIELYVTGQRTMPPAMVGEGAFHSPDHAHKELDQVLTVVWAKDRTEAGLLDALRQGRSYAVEQHRKEFRLALDEFQLLCPSRGNNARPGDTLDAEGCRDMVARVAVSATDHKPHPITVTLVRSGEVVSRVTGETPFLADIPDPIAPSGRPLSYRVAVTGGGEILSNPVFVKPLGALTAT